MVEGEGNISFGPVSLSGTLRAGLVVAAKESPVVKSPRMATTVSRSISAIADLDLKATGQGVVPHEGTEVVLTEQYAVKGANLPPV